MLVVCLFLVFVSCIPRYPVIQFGPPAGGAGTEMWQLHQANQPPICAYELTFNMPPGSTVATPLSSFLAAPAAPNGIAPPAPLAGPFAAMARCAQSGFYMYLVECTAAAPAGFGLVGFDNCASLHSPAAAAAAAAGATTEFVIAFVGRTEEQLAEQYRQHRKEINGANARSAKGVAWRAWFESRRSFFVGFPAVDSLATALQMMLLRPYIPGGSSGFKFPLNDDSSWPGLLPPSTISLAASINYPSLLKYREHMLVGCAGIAGGAANQQFTAVAALAVHHAATVALAWPGGLTCPAGAMVAWAPPALQRGAPGPRWTDLGSFGAPTFIGDAIPLPGQFAFDGVPFGAAPHKVALTATEWHTVINGALLALEGTRQMIGAALP